jgi:hypothetical protein
VEEHLPSIDFLTSYFVYFDEAKLQTTTAIIRSSKNNRFGGFRELVCASSWGVVKKVVSHHKRPQKVGGGMFCLLVLKHS